MRCCSGSQTARCAKADRSKSPPSSRLMRTSRFRLKAAVTPSGSSYASSSVGFALDEIRAQQEEIAGRQGARGSDRGTQRRPAYRSFRDSIRAAARASDRRPAAAQPHAAGRLRTWIDDRPPRSAAAFRAAAPSARAPARRCRSGGRAPIRLCACSASASSTSFSPLPQPSSTIVPSLSAMVETIGSA